VTAQVVILNKLAAAVASDSSVTLSSGNVVRRSFPTGDKIFPLRQPHLLAVLHSGDTELLGVPYIVLLGEWARTLPDERLRLVSDYAASFGAWVEDQTELFTEKVQDGFLEWILRDFFLGVRAELLRRCELAGIADDEWGSAEADDLVRSVTSERLRYLQKRPRHNGFENFDGKAFFEQRASMLDNVREWVFDDTPRTAEGDANLAEIAAELVGADEPYARDASLVFAGFGDMELFPAVQKVDYRGMLAGKLRTTFDEYEAISSENNASLSPYAQSEAVNTFLRGYNSDFLRAAHNRLDLVLGTADDNDATSDPKTVGERGHTELNEDFEKLSWESFVQPLVETVAGLPAVELARIAESLVGLQVLRQLTQAQGETVGGPVDVALITRDGGVSWVHRKASATGAR
jgi:hypothetical protein